MTGLDLDALEAVARAATPGPWHQGVHYIGAGGEPHDPEVQVGQASAIRDAKHMAAFDPGTALALIARVKEEQQKRAEAEAVIARITEWGENVLSMADAVTLRDLASYKTTNDENGGE